MQSSKARFVVLAIAMTLLMPLQIQANEAGLFVLGGMSLFNEKSSEGIAEGNHIRLGVGQQFNERLGLEMTLEYGPALGIDALVDNYADDLGVNVSSYTLLDNSKNYISLSGTWSTPLDSGFALITKVGVSHYRATAQGFVFIDESLLSLEIQEFKTEESGITPVIAAGIVLEMNDFSVIELTGTKTFEDSPVTQSLNLIYRLRI